MIMYIALNSLSHYYLLDEATPSRGRGYGKDGENQRHPTSSFSHSPTSNHATMSKYQV
ncbi:hypothetical protein [Aneurinibacillus migulanus]|uniref:hypothetical protein n=1 Tax=Aneurinibacillus migulanus TaxID=47500 RepID=UPI000FAAEA42|nr:hypothetical protein [Aneurinibacillus migulanus]